MPILSTYDHIFTGKNSVWVPDKLDDIEIHVPTFTDCGYCVQVCVGGNCQEWPGVGPSPPVVEGGWSPWEQTPCISGCLEQGTGVQVSHLIISQGTSGMSSLNVTAAKGIHLLFDEIISLNIACFLSLCQVSRRTCTHPKPLNTNLRCPGSSLNLTFCDDSQVNI